MSTYYRIPIALILVLALGVPAVAAGGAKLPDPTPRVLLAGDSWTGFLWAFRTFREILPDYPGLENYIERGSRTAVMGARVFEFLEPGSVMLDVIAEELEDYPTIDVVVITFGGNSMMRGIPLDPSHTGPESECRCDQGEGENQIVIDAIVRDIGEVVDHILAQRPDIRVCLCSYDFGGSLDQGCDPEEGQMGFVRLGETKIAQLCDDQRVFYVNNYGLMHHEFGLDSAENPENVEPPVVVAPGGLPMPGDYPTYDPMPGGDVRYLAPYESLIDNDIHLTQEGYELLAHRMMDEFLEEWLNYPKAFEILPLDVKIPEIQFDVTFSEDVTGVDVSDFQVVVVTPDKTAKAASVTEVFPAAGPASRYTVTVDPDDAVGIVRIVLNDDDSIIDGLGTPLGGIGVGNGDFTFNGAFSLFDLPAPGDTDFEGSLLFFEQTVAPYEGLIGGFSFAPDVLDINGNIDLIAILAIVEAVENGDPFSIPRNGILEDHEFAVIEAVLNDPNLDLSAFGGLSHAEVMAAWTTNINQMQHDLGGIGGLADILLPGLDTFMAGFVTLGDENSIFLVKTLLGPLALGGEEISEQFPVNITPPNIEADYVPLPQFFAWNGDADGDGFSNAEEYVVFGPDGKGAYVNAALDPTIHPEPNGGFFAAGDVLRLTVWPEATEPPAYFPHLIDEDATFQWYKDDAPLADALFLSGAQTRVLKNVNLGLEDSGWYYCLWDDGVKAAQKAGPYYVFVGENVPIAGGMGLAALGLLAGALGVATLRRRMK